MTNVLARCAVVCSLLLLAGCDGDGNNNVSPGVCSPGEFRCSGNVLETCSQSRTGFTTVATCRAGLCDAAGKQCDNCKAGEGTCSGPAAGKLCSADGQELEDVTCTGDTPFCVASGKEAACVACRTSVDCAVSSNPCQLSVCNADGTCGSVAVAVDTICSASGGKCDGAGSCRECNAGDKRCSGIQPQSCGTDGRWVTASACASPSPLCLGGDCIQCIAASDCPASANPCTQAVCSSGMCGYVAKAQGTACAGGTCNGAGLCNACSPGSKVCNGNQVLSCNSNGQYDAPSNCGGSTPYCENSTGSCVQCTSVAQCAAPTNPCLQAVCAGNTCGVSARQDGTVCAVGNEAGTCQAGACTLCAAGQTRCQPGTNIPQSCSGGLWVGSAACASSTALCNAGACVECITAANCPASSNACLQAVCSSGVCGYAAKAQGTACSGGTCNGTGQCNACTPNSTVCNGNQVLTCNSSGQYAAPTTCSAPTPYCDGATTTCVQCTSAAHCTAPTNPCLQATCSGGSCGVSVRADGTACSVSGDSGTCSAGNCAVCTNGATRCKPGVTTTPQVCSGGQWADQPACGLGQFCLGGACIAQDYAVKLTGGPVTIDPGQLGIAGSPATVEGWFRLDVRDDYSHAWSVVDKASGERIWGVHHLGWAYPQARQDKMAMLRDLVFDTTGGIISTGTWTHLAVSHDGTTYRLFQDGQLTASANSALYLFSSGPAGVTLVVGSQIAAFVPNTNWDGSVDEFRVSAGARYTTNFQPPVHLAADTDTRVLLYFNDGSGTTANSAIVGGPVGTLASGAVWQTITR